MRRSPKAAHTAIRQAFPGAKIWCLSRSRDSGLVRDVRDVITDGRFDLPLEALALTKIRRFDAYYLVEREAAVLLDHVSRAGVRARKVDVDPTTKKFTVDDADYRRASRTLPGGGR